MDSEVDWILWRIKDLEKKTKERLERGKDDPDRWPTHRNIWQGCYDVWHCEQDRIDAVNIPLAKMKTAEETGLIKSEVKQWRKYQYTVWSLTDAGKTALENSEWGKVND